ncbi:MAG: pantoate--beta-alanine ligase [Acidobacteria bacterium]|nr:pantoate--beta-alanine ligase [Acidobacteriota bacterium]
METLTSPERMRALAREFRAQGERIGYVPTMGALHEGHLSLIRRSKQLATRTVVSLFVNPTQFGPSEDFRKYPRNPERDAELARLAGADVLYAPRVGDVYPPGYRTYVAVEGLGTTLEGASRPGHFRGVATVVVKLLNRVAPHVALFGQKDAQQAILIKKLVRDLEVDLEIEVCPTVREEDGLAMSSRNAYLTPEQRRAAPVLYRALKRAESAVVREKERRAERIVDLIRETVAAEPYVSLDYAEVVDAGTLAPLERIEGSVLIPIAARVGATRLIDNVILKVEE